MARLLHDRFVLIDDRDARDLATGGRVRLQYVSSSEGVRDVDRRLGTCVDWGSTPDGGRFEAWDKTPSSCEPPSFGDVETLLELLDQGCDGEPRRLAMTARDGAAKLGLWRLVAREARRRGYVPLWLDLFESVTRSLAGELLHRTLVLLDVSDQPVAGDGPNALARAATVSPRPHVLVTIGCRRVSRPWSLVREARGTYAATGTAAARVSPPGPSADTVKYMSRARRAEAVAREGRHSEAERGLREAEAALARRHAWDGAAGVGVMLGRLLLSRGRAEAADLVFGAAVAAGERAQDVWLAHDARVWLASARIDAGRLTDGEALLRAMRIAQPDLRGWRRDWSEGVLARCLMWQDRDREALDALSQRSIEPLEGSIDAETAATTLVTRLEALLRNGYLFDAGRLARGALTLAEDAGDDAARLVAELGHLRVLGSAGDLDLVGSRLADVLKRARALHAPLSALCARVIWMESLRRAGRASEAAREHERLRRMARMATPVLRRYIDLPGREHQVDYGRRPARGETDRLERLSAAAPAHVNEVAIPLLRLAQQEQDDVTALQKIAERLASLVRAGRTEFQAAHMGPGGLAGTIAASGSGAMPTLGRRAFDAGAVIGPEEIDGVWEVGAPVRFSSRTIAAVACRWPVGRTPPREIGAALEVAAAVGAPRVDAWLTSKAEATQATTAIPELVGTSDTMTDVRRAIARAGAAPFAVLIEGESGVGKELVARAIHQLSPRRERRFCDVNCAALPDELVESELFGHARGAFTGAMVERKGLFEEAHGGTLFLDELPDLSLRAQAKLLRVLQQHEVRRLGETFTRPVDVRLVTATNRSMAEETTEGRFRRDLLYRLDVIRIRMPPLRERPGDIPQLARHFWSAAAARTATTATLSHGVLSELARYHWPGNVRELQNVMAALAVAAPARGVVRSGLLPAGIAGALAVSGGRLADARHQFERRFVETALARAGGSRTRCAAQLGVSRQGLLKLLVRLGLDAQAAGGGDVRAP